MCRFHFWFSSFASLENEFHTELQLPPCCRRSGELAKLWIVIVARRSRSACNTPRRVAEKLNRRSALAWCLLHLQRLTFHAALLF